MYQPRFKEHSLYPKISMSITTVVASSLAIVLASSAIITRKYFKTARTLSGYKTIVDLMLVLGVNYLGLTGLASWIHNDVSVCKAEYLKEYNPEFMLHFDVICAKYGIDEEKQTEGIFTR